MFTQKKTQLFTKEKKTKKSTDTGTSLFVNAGLKDSAKIKSGNGALKYSTTGDSFVDQFGKLGSYKAPRSFSDISKDCETLWAEDPLKAVRFAFYLRTITRKVKLLDGTTTQEVQRGAELKHEALMRIIWLAQKDSATFKENFPLFVSLGSWHDVFTVLQYDLVYNGWDKKVLDWSYFGSLILSGLDNQNTCELVKKYLPQIKAKSACSTVESQANTIIGKWVCSLLFGTKESSANYKKYRQMKNSGTAHSWQQLISQKKFNKIDFDKVHGRALNLLVRGKFLANQGLKEKYEQWVKKDTTEVKYTGFVHELFGNLPSSLSSLQEHERVTINKQFDTLVQKGKTDEVSSLIVVRDTSGSMGSTATGTKVSCYNIGKALALYFSEFLTGKFANSFIEFNSTAKMHKWKGSTPLEKWYNDHTGFYGSTNFLSVVRLFAKIKNEGVEESEFPTGILCISDSEFNPASLGKTNVEESKKILRQAGFSKDYVDNFVIVLWNLQSSYYGRGTGEKFETYGDVKNVFYFSGYSASVVAFLTSQVETASELLDSALNQEVLNMVQLVKSDG